MSQLVSVCMPAKNAAAWLTEAVESILSQTHEDLELIVVDDGSVDHTLDLLSDLSRKDSRVSFHSSPGSGVVAARRKAFRHASGSFVANMDADDLSLPHRLEAQVEVMNAGFDLCGTQFDYLFGTERRSPRNRLPLTQPDAFVQLFRSNPVSNPSIMFRRSMFDGEGLPYNPSYVPSADYELWSRLLPDPAIRFENLPGVHMLYRAHRDQLTKPNAFPNRVAAARVRLSLVQAYDLDLDDSALRQLCVPDCQAEAKNARSTGTDDRLDEQLRSLANRIFANRAP